MKPISIKVSTYVKLVISYIFLIMLTSFFIMIVFSERRQRKQIDKQLNQVDTLYNIISAANQKIIELSLQGESVINWDESDYQRYHNGILNLAEIIQHIKPLCQDFIQPNQLDTLRGLFVAKDSLFKQISSLLVKQGRINSSFIKQKPLIIRDTTQVNSKKNIFNIFKRKGIQQIQTIQYNINPDLLKQQKRHFALLTSHIDSLDNSNTLLNKQLDNLITELNYKKEQFLSLKKQNINKMQQESSILISIGGICIIIFIIVSFIVIYNERKQISNYRIKLEGIISENKSLIDVQKKIMLTVSHDIRGPLNSIYGSTELAMDTVETKKRNIYLKNTLRSCKHVLNLVNGLLEIYRLNESKELKKDMLFWLNELLSTISDKFAILANSKGLEFHNTFTSTDVFVKGDADRIEQIVDNLLANAIKFTNQGVIQFSANYKDNTLYVNISDTGVGMSQETISRIFYPFERAVSSQNVEGFGLGLAITQGLIELLDGEISVNSILGGGSSFCISLPLPQTEDRIEENINERKIDNLPKKVLVVDDDFIQLEMIKDMLERNKISCTICHSTNEVIDCMRRLDFDVILTDIQMPETNGFELLELLRTSHVGNSQTIPVIAMTAQGESKIETFLESGFAGYIYKPFSMTELLNLISSTMSFVQEKNDITNFSPLINDCTDKIKLLDSFIQEAGKNKGELYDGIKKRSYKQLRATVHRMSPTWRLLKRESELEEYRMFLHEESDDWIIIGEKTESIICIINKFISDAEKEYVTHKSKKNSFNS